MIGDQHDIYQRLKSRIPQSWFGDNGSVIDSLLNGLAKTWAFAYSLYGYLLLQSRINTATDAWLDAIAKDFYGTGLLRLPNEMDSQYRARISSTLFVEQSTRNAIYYSLLRLTGRAPIIFEPFRPADTGALISVGQVGVYGLALNYAGGLGSPIMPYQALVTAFLPSTSGIPLIAGLGYSVGALSTPSRAALAGNSSQQVNQSIAAIYQAVEKAKPVGTEIWVATTY